MVRKLNCTLGDLFDLSGLFGLYDLIDRFVLNDAFGEWFRLWPYLPTWGCGFGPVIIFIFLQ